MKLVVLSCVLAAASTSVVGIAPLTYSAPLAYSAPFAYAAPLGLVSSNYRGPLSLAPGQPANILAADGRPLDTLDVNWDRSAHFVAKALNGGVHLLKKRSVTPLIAPIAPIAGHVAFAHAPLTAPGSFETSRIAHIGHIAPYTAYTTPYTSYW